MIDEYWTFRLYGYYSDDLTHGAHNPIVAVCDDCYQYRVLPNYAYRDLCRSCAGMRKKITGHLWSEKQKIVRSEQALAPKDPLPNGWKGKLKNITTNKESSSYLGSVAEVILANIYDDVIVMPILNHGFDVICNRNLKIDIKSSATGDKRGKWQFHTNHNVIADYFLCVAFNNRDDLYNPVHLWMIPSDHVKHSSRVNVSKSKLDKWVKYEQSIDKLQTCCKQRQ